MLNQRCGLGVGERAREDFGELDGLCRLRAGPRERSIKPTARPLPLGDGAADGADAWAGAPLHWPSPPRNHVIHFDHDRGTAADVRVDVRLGALLDDSCLTG